MGNAMEQRIKNVMSAVFEIPVNKIKGSASPDTIESWDSLKHMEFIISLEDQFNVNLTGDEIASLQTIDDVILMLKMKLG